MQIVFLSTSTALGPRLIQVIAGRSQIGRIRWMTTRPVDFSTSYLGIALSHPLVASASPLSGTLEGVKRLDRAGVSAIVLESLFQEEIESEFADLVTAAADKHRPLEYMRLIERSREAVDVPIIASLNGIGTNGWLQLASDCQDAGAHALELNLYHLPTDPRRSSLELEKVYLDQVREAASLVSIPLSVKISPFFTSLPNMAHKLAGAGARGLVMFNRFHQPVVDLEAMASLPQIKLSRPVEASLPIGWTSLLYRRVALDLAVTGGVNGAEQVLQAVLAGANIVMIASRFLKDGPEVTAEILREMASWMRRRDLLSLRLLQGRLCSSQQDARTRYRQTMDSFEVDARPVQGARVGRPNLES